MAENFDNRNDSQDSRKTLPHVRSANFANVWQPARHEAKGDEKNGQLLNMQLVGMNSGCTLLLLLLSRFSRV